MKYILNILCCWVLAATVQAQTTAPIDANAIAGNWKLAVVTVQIKDKTTGSLVGDAKSLPLDSVARIQNFTPAELHFSYSNFQQKTVAGEKSYGYIMVANNELLFFKRSELQDSTNKQGASVSGSPEDSLLMAYHIQQVNSGQLVLELRLVKKDLVTGKSVVEEYNYQYTQAN